jgi:hypothetical protein
MELVDRYLQAVKFWLPREQQDDIARELSEDIVSEIEEKERGLGRLMKPAEIEAVLKGRGRPFVVANGYLPQRQLIGPLLFPIYALVLKIIGFVYVLPWIIVWTFLLAFAPSYRGHVMSDLGTLWSMVVQIFATVTIIFAIQEHYFGAPKLLREWDPRHLPAVRKHDVNRIPRSSSIAEIVVNLLFIGWWAGGFPIAYGFQHGWITGTIWPEFHRTFFVPILILALTTISVAAVNVIRPYWTRTRRLIHAAANGATAAIAAWAVATHAAAVQTSLHLLHAVHGAPPPAAVAAIVDATVLIALVIVAVVCAITCGVEIYRATASSTYRTTSKLAS